MGYLRRVLSRFLFPLLFLLLLLLFAPFLVFGGGASIRRSLLGVGDRAVVASSSPFLPPSPSFGAREG